VHGQSLAIRNSVASLIALIGHAENAPNREVLQGRVERESLAIRTALAQIRDHLAPLAYPFEHAEKEMTIGNYIVPGIPDATDYGNLLEAASDALPRYGELSLRIAGELCRIAEAVETTLGFPPLPLPPPSASAEDEDESED
jgi:hypothetical protein